MKEKFLLSFILLITIGTVYYLSLGEMEHFVPRSKGTIIILNGGSSCGKTTIAKRLQDVLDEPYLLTSMDSFIAMLPKREEPTSSSGSGVVPTDGIQFTQADDEDGPKVEIKVGPSGEELISGMWEAIASLARQGNKVIVDSMIVRKSWLVEGIKALKDHHRVYVVGVRCPLEIAAQWERDSNELVGLARGTHEKAHEHMVYDIEVDASAAEPLEHAMAIKQFMNENPKPRAFKKLKKHLCCKKRKPLARE